MAHVRIQQKMLSLKNKNTFQIKKHLHNRKKITNFAPQISVHWWLYAISAPFLMFIALKINKLLNK